MGMIVSVMRFSFPAGKAVDSSEVVEKGIPDFGILRTFGRQALMLADAPNSQSQDPVPG